MKNKKPDCLRLGNWLTEKLAYTHMEDKAVPSVTFSCLGPLLDYSQFEIKQLRAPDSNHFPSVKGTDTTVENLPSTYCGL